MWSRARDAVDWAVAALWRSGLAMLRSPGRPNTARWSGNDRRPVLVIAPHPDDEVIGCGGVMLLHLQGGDPVTVAHVTDGRGSRAGQLDPDAMASRRRSEAAACLSALGVEHWHWLGLPEWKWDESEAVGVLVTLLDRSRPSLIYAPSRVDFHPEHERVARVLGRALRSAACDATIRVYGIGVPLTGILANVVADVSTVWDRVGGAMAMYRSQHGAWRFSLRAHRYAAAAHRLDRAGEEFWEMPAHAYVALHEEPAAAMPRRVFRGFRRMAWTDPLAYLQGRSERRRLWRISQDATTP